MRHAWQGYSTTVCVLLLTLTHVTGAKAADVKVFTSRAVATVLAEIRPKFEAASGHKLDVVVDLTPTLVQRARAGEPFDVIVALPKLIDDLIKEGHAIADTRTKLVHSGLGLETRAGAVKPDIGSVGAFKRALLNFKSIGYLKTPAGVHLDQEFARLGIAEVISSKAVRPNTDIVSQLVANGAIEAGIVVKTQILTTPGVQLVGSLPDELQYYVAFVGAVSTRSNVPGPARDLLKFLTGPDAVRVIRSQGMDPG
jgi:molybdate transport system substrate-binding protein